MFNTNSSFKGNKSSAQTQLVGLASPIQLALGKTEVLLSDYFVPPFTIEKFQGHGALAIDFVVQQQKLVLHPKPQLPKLSVLTVWIAGVPHSILVKKSRKVATTFVFEGGGKDYQEVAIAGEMNNWEAATGKMSNEGGKWAITYALNPGKYAYQFVIDGAWKLDETNPHSKDNNMGGFNSVITVAETDQLSKPRLNTLAHHTNSIEIEIEQEIDELFVFWNNLLIPPSEILRRENKAIITIPKAAQSSERSYIRVFAHKANQEANDLKLLLHHGKVVYQSEMLQRTDQEAYIMYFILIDRFFKGDPTIDAPILDDRLNDKANFYGGDLAGILTKLREGYFKQLNVNTLWLSPLNQNPLKAFQEWPEPRKFFSGYHGYWPISHTDIDYRFGDYTLFEELVEALHEEDANIILDFVSNHIHQDHPLYQDHPDWVTPLKLADGQFNIRLWNEYRFSTWFETFLPTLDYAKPEVVQEMVNVALHWLLEFDIDGFRHDASKHIPEHFWRSLTLNIKKDIILSQERKLYQVGETFGSRELIGSYVTSGKLDAQFDFNLYFDARMAFALPHQSFKLLHESLEESLAYYGSHHLMCNITGNHDLARFISYAGGELRFDEDTKIAGWERTVTVGDPIAYKRLSALTAFIMTIPGIPVIYYGDEIGLPGAEDPDNRRPMKFEHLSKQEQQTKAIASKLAGLRKNNLALTLGDFQLLHLSDQIYAYARIYFDQLIVVAFNKSATTETIQLSLPERFNQHELQANFGSTIWQRQRTLHIKLESESFDLLT